MHVINYKIFNLLCYPATKSIIIFLNKIYNYILKEKPNKKFVELNKMTTDFRFVDAVGTKPQCIYIPIVKLIKPTLRFPINT